MGISAIIPAGAWLWDRYGRALTDRAVGEVKGRWERFRWNDAAEQYRAKVKRLYGTMQIMGMSQPVILDDIFTDAYLLDQPTAFTRFNIERLKIISADPAKAPSAERINGLRLVTQNRNLFILGKPGAGKTTFLKYIAIKAAEAIIDRVPIFVSLKEWADSDLDLVPFVVERFDVCDFPDALPFVEQLLKSGSAIVLFDGLDEVNQESGQRDKQTHAINRFVDKYDTTQHLITCRIAASDYSFKPFSYVEIADFTETQIKAFISNWFRNKEGEKDTETCKRFLAEFSKPENKGLRDLARTPLLLTLLCLAFNETLTFPQRRVEIYEEAVDALLKRWDASRRIKRDEIYRKLSLGHKENMLAQIAWETFERNQYFIPQAELETLIVDYTRRVPPNSASDEIDGEAILKAMESRHGILVERTYRVYSFSHLTFQEYFAAKFIASNTVESSIENWVQKHCADVRWREVFLLTTSLLPDASSLINELKRVVDNLLGEDETLRRLLSWVDQKAKLLNVDPYLARQGYLFLELHDLSTNQNLRRALQLERSHGWAFDEARGLHHSRKSGWRELLNPTSSLGKSASAAVPEPKWELTLEQEDRFAKYLNATRLLKDSLDLATMAPERKNAILNGLCLPQVENQETIRKTL